MALFLAAAAFSEPAAPLSRDQLLSEQQGSEIGARGIEPGQLPLKPQLGAAVVTGMPFDLPAGSVKAGGRLTLSVTNGPRVYVEETIVLPDAIGSEPTIAFLANHPGELEQVRKAAAARPETIRFTITADGRAIAELPFVDADRGSANLADGGSVVGTTESVTVRMRDPRKAATNGMVPDPDCAAGCEQAFYDCYTYCDERGAGCPWCQEQYNDCLFYCPQVCVEPKDVYDVYTAWTHISTTNHGQICINWTSAYFLYEYVLRRYRYERTVHCDNSYTDVYKATEYGSSWCKQYLGPGCVGSFTNPPPNC